MLKDPPLLTVRRMWQRPDAFTLGRLKGVQTGQAVDAMQGRGALDAAIKAIDPANAFFLGTALPCETGPNDNLAILAAVALAQPGDVIMAASEGFAQSAVVGDNVTMVAKGKGAAAIVIDGMARDIAGIAPVGLPVFARGITPNSCVRSGPGRVGLPIVIGGFEAQAIAVALEKMHPSRPLTHDLMKNFMSAFTIDLQEIVICDLQEGIFYSKLLCVSEHDTVEIDSRTSDALALAVRFGCPIYTYDNILESAGILMEDASGKKKVAREAVTTETHGAEDLKSLSLDELNTLLAEVLEQEDYIRAISIRDEINSRGKNG